MAEVLPTGHMSEVTLPLQVLNAPFRTYSEDY